MEKYQSQAQSTNLQEKLKYQNSEVIKSRVITATFLSLLAHQLEGVTCVLPQVHSKG